MDVKVNEAIIKEVLDDEKFKAEVIEFLNSIVDEELEKGGRMDTNLVTDCTELVFELENGYEALNIQRESANKIIKFCHKKTKSNNGFKTVAAVVAIMLIAHTATYYTLPAYAKVVDTFVEQIISLLNSDAQKTDDGSAEVSEIRVEEPEGFNEHISSAEEADLKGFKVYAIDFDGNEKEIPLSDCIIEKHKLEEGGKTMLEVSVSYKGCVEFVVYIID